MFEMKRVYIESFLDAAIITHLIGLGTMFMHQDHKLLASMRTTGAVGGSLSLLVAQIYTQRRAVLAMQC